MTRLIPNKRFSAGVLALSLTVLLGAASAHASLIAYDLRYDPFFVNFVTVDARIFFDDALITPGTPGNPSEVLVDHFDFTFTGADGPFGANPVVVSERRGNRSTDATPFGGQGFGSNSGGTGLGPNFIPIIGTFDSASRFTGNLFGQQPLDFLSGLFQIAFVGTRAEISFFTNPGPSKVFLPFGSFDIQNAGATIPSNFTFQTVPPPAVPEPSTALLFGAGLMGLAGIGRPRRGTRPRL